MSADDPLPPLREVIATHGLAARKALGQNFLLDLNLTRKIARRAGSLDDHDVMEVGPGPGGLTRALLMEGARHVHAIERDPRCLPALAEVASAFPGRLTVIQGDALDIRYPPEARMPLRVVANLPYNVGTELLIRWLTSADWPPPWASLTLMFQKEVADRITGQPGTGAYGRLAILAQWRADARKVMEVPPQAFTPPPKVTSAVVHLTPLAAPRAAANLKDLESVTRAAFGQRRKMLRQSLKPVLKTPVETLTALGIDPTARPETLDIEAFAAIARARASKASAT